MKIRVVQIEYGSVLARRVNRVFLVICGSVLALRSDWRHTVLARHATHHATQQNVVGESKNMKHVKSSLTKSEQWACSQPELALCKYTNVHSVCEIWTPTTLGISSLVLEPVKNQFFVVFFRRKIYFQEKYHMSTNIFRKISHKNGFLTFPCKIYKDAPMVCWSWYFACEQE